MCQMVTLQLPPRAYYTVRPRNVLDTSPIAATAHSPSLLLVVGRHAGAGGVVCVGDSERTSP